MTLQTFSGEVTLVTKQVRHLEELGENLQKIMKRLLANQKLLRYLYYTDKDPLNNSKDDVTSDEAYRDGRTGVVRIVPVIDEKDNSQSVLTLRILKGVPSEENSEFLEIYFVIEVFVPTEQWIMKGANLRPYAIMGEVQRSLDDKKINGLGEIKGSGFSVNFFTEEISAFLMSFRIIQYN